jgi:hypothetical protein
MSSVGTNIDNDVWRKGGQMQVTCSFGTINARHRWRSQRSRSPRNAGSCGRCRVPAKTKTTRWIEARGMRDSERAHKHSIHQHYNKPEPHSRGSHPPKLYPRSLRWSTSIDSSHNCFARRRRIRRDATTKSHWTCLKKRQYKPHCCRTTWILY